MEQDEFKKLIHQALQSVAAESPRLPLENVGERAIVARIACHLDRFVRALNLGLSVDVEYNVDPVGDRKWLDADRVLKEAAEKARRKIYEDDSIVVIPDIVVHKRQTHANNFAVIEVKFADAPKSEVTYATLKLEAFKGDLFKYEHGVLLKIPRDWNRFVESGNIEIV